MSRDKKYISPVIESISIEKTDIIRTSSDADLLSADYGDGSAKYNWSEKDLFTY